MIDLKETVREMKEVAKNLVSRSFPLVTREEEVAIAELKKRKVVVNGYHIGLYYNECQYGKYLLNSLQVFGRSHPYLPFDLVTDVAVRFLGKHKLSLIEVPYEGKSSTRKIYVWTVYYGTESVAVDNPFHTTSTPGSYGDIKFNKINSHDVKFF
jgi:hypothetical protein